MKKALNCAWKKPYEFEDFRKAVAFPNQQVAPS